ncbi:MAG TPA: zf-TFIIB domain-containing protein [Caulobacteraceae bacterium]|nr:zf-TFIIB domain-containing protein [Caulobacteraceae bacterium]
MKCPVCNIDLIAAQRDGIEAECCPNCKGTWLSAQELGELEDEAFDLGDQEKGTLVFSSTPTERKCPQCEAPMRRFEYRLYDLDLEFCPDSHGYWLDADEDKKLLDFMRKEEARLKRTGRAQDKWTSVLQHLRSRSFLDKLRSAFQ